MNNIITTTGRNINTITAEIVTISNQAAQMAYMAMIEIGRRLVEAKSLVDHGEWGDYLKNEVQFSQRSANNFMRAYERSQNGANSQTFANLGYSQIVKLLALPDEEIEAFTQTHDVASMSVRELDRAIKERDEERKLREKSEKEAEKLRKQVERAEKSEAVAQKNAKYYQEHPNITDEMKAALTSAAIEETESRVRSESQAQLDAARKENAQLSGELELLRGQRDAARRENQMSDPDMMAINLLGKGILDDLNRLHGYRLRVIKKNPEMEQKIQMYLKRLVEEFAQRAGVAE